MQPPDHNHVTVTSGIYCDRFPIRGILVGEARRALKELLNIHVDAIAVVDGVAVDDKIRISETVELLTFIRQSAEIRKE
jgi:hypothetical protein